MKNKKNIFITFLMVIIALGATIGFSYAIFGAKVLGSGKAHTIETGALSLTYTDGLQIQLHDAIPGDYVTKTLTVENTGTYDTAYNINLLNLKNTLINDEIEITFECESFKNYGEDSEESLGVCEEVWDYPISYTPNPKTKRIMEQIEIAPGVTHEYSVMLYYVEYEELQNYNQGKTFSTTINIEEYQDEYSLQGKLVDDLGDPIVGATIEVHSDVKSAITGSQGNYLIKGVTLGNHKLIIKDSNNEILAQKNISITTGNSNSAENATITIDDSGKTGFVNLVIDNGRIALENSVANLDCVFNNGATPVQGDTYTDANGIYTYKYKQKAVYDEDSDVVYWQDMDEDGWGVQLIDLESTGAVVEPICSSINGKPVVSTSGMYANSQASSIDLSTLDTSNVTDMHAMFAYSGIEELDLSTFDTSNVTDMSWMFYWSQATALDLSTFNTSNVTDMSNMFFWSEATSLDLSTFDTSNVTDMHSMFIKSQATSLDLSTFDTSNVTDMSWMFNYSQATALDLSLFNTSNVTNMSGMFSGSQATSLDLSSFDTSRVTDMSLMFDNSQATSLDLSSFNTSNVTNMSAMFVNSQATSIDLSTFDTSNVTNMYHMFQYSEATSLDLSSFNTSNVTNMSRMFQGAKATIGYARNSDEAAKFNATRYKPNTLVFN